MVVKRNTVPYRRKSIQLQKEIDELKQGIQEVNRFTYTVQKFKQNMDSMSNENAEFHKEENKQLLKNNGQNSNDHSEFSKELEIENEKIQKQLIELKEKYNEEIKISWKQSQQIQQYLQQNQKLTLKCNELLKQNQFYEKQLKLLSYDKEIQNNIEFLEKQQKEQSQSQQLEQSKGQYSKHTSSESQDQLKLSNKKAIQQEVIIKNQKIEIESLNQQLIEQGQIILDQEDYIKTLNKKYKSNQNQIKIVKINNQQYHFDEDNNNYEIEEYRYQKSPRETKNNTERDKNKANRVNKKYQDYTKKLKVLEKFIQKSQLINEKLTLKCQKIQSQQDELLNKADQQEQNIQNYKDEIKRLTVHKQNLEMGIQKKQKELESTASENPKIDKKQKKQKKQAVKLPKKYGYKQSIFSQKKFSQWKHKNKYSKQSDALQATQKIDSIKKNIIKHKQQETVNSKKLNEKLKSKFNVQTLIQKYVEPKRQIQLTKKYKESELYKKLKAYNKKNNDCEQIFSQKNQLNQLNKQKKQVLNFNKKLKKDEKVKTKTHNLNKPKKKKLEIKIHETIPKQHFKQKQFQAHGFISPQYKRTFINPKYKNDGINKVKKYRDFSQPTHPTDRLYDQIVSKLKTPTAKHFSSFSKIKPPLSIQTPQNLVSSNRNFYQRTQTPNLGLRQKPFQWINNYKQTSSKFFDIRQKLKKGHQQPLRYSNSCFSFYNTKNQVKV